MAFVPCTMCCGVPMLMMMHTKGPSGPSDATRLSDDEAKLYLDSLQGLWDIVLTDVPGLVSGIGANRLNFSRAYISGNRATYSMPINRGRHGGGAARFSETLTFSKTPDGTIFIDERGTSIT